MGDRLGRWNFIQCLFAQRKIWNWSLTLFATRLWSVCSCEVLKIHSVRHFARLSVWGHSNRWILPMIPPLELFHHFGFSLSLIRFWYFRHSWKNYWWSPWEPNQHKPVQHIDRQFVDLRNKACNWRHSQFVTGFWQDLPMRVLDTASRDQT
jgi:hypothetical protein